MNLEHLANSILLNYTKIINKKLAFQYFNYHYNLLLWKKNKLKLGAIVFEIKETKVENFVLWEDIDIRYIKQDNTDTDELKLENRLKALAWKWDFKNYFALFVVFIFFFTLFYSYLYCWYCNNLPTFAFQNKKFFFLISYSMNILFPIPIITFLKKTLFINIWVIQLLTEYCVNFNILF